MALDLSICGQFGWNPLHSRIRSLDETVFQRIVVPEGDRATIAGHIRFDLIIDRRGSYGASGKATPGIRLYQHARTLSRSGIKRYPSAFAISGPEICIAAAPFSLRLTAASKLKLTHGAQPLSSSGSMLNCLQA